MSEIYNSDAYKMAKRLLKDKDKLLNAINTSEALLTPHKAYFHVAKCLKQLKDSKTMMILHIQTAEKVITNKGRIK